MKIAEIPENENERLNVLNGFQILDTDPERDFDEITKLAAEICETPISLISFVDLNRQWFKSHHGLGLNQSPRDTGFCAHIIGEPTEFLMVKDARKDERFHDNPLVLEDPNVVFYAGVPLITSDGYSLGTLCVIDHSPKELTQKQIDSLSSLANQVVKLLELRKKNIQLEESQRQIIKKNKELEKFAHVVSHDIKSPLNNIIAMIELFKKECAANLDEDGIRYLNYIDNSSSILKMLTEGILSYSKGEHIVSQQKEEIDLHQFIKDSIELLDIKQEFQFKYPQSSILIYANKIALQQIFINLLVNSMKYNDKVQGIIEISFSETTSSYCFSVKDNGRGIAEKHLDKIFNVFVNLGVEDRNKNMGSGIGLSTVKNLINLLGGNISISSELGKGTEFTFEIPKE